jgi:uncharacterized integral membrane protein (TIGR00697 family)
VKNSYKSSEATTPEELIPPLDRKGIVLAACISMFVGALLISSITASKVYDINLFGFIITVPVGTSLFAFTFFATDVTSEVWGKKHSTMLVLCGFVMRILALVFLYVAVWIHPSPFWENQAAYESVLTGSGRILLAGILTYPVSQLTDIFIFHSLKKRHGSRNLLWFRNISSTFFSQLVDSTVFILLAFGGVMPNAVLLTMVVGQICVKWFIAICDTPFVYMARNYALGRPILDFKG